MRRAMTETATYGDAGARKVYEHPRKAQCIASEPACADERERERRQRAVGDWGHEDTRQLART